MPTGLRRITGYGDLHFVNFACFHRRANLATADARNIALRHLGAVREEYEFALLGYVFMPEHVHLLMSEPANVPPSRVVQVFKERVADEIFGRAAGQFWQRRYFDFNVHTTAKLKQKLHYMHENPVMARLVKHPGDWPWSSWSYYYRGKGLLAMDSLPPGDSISDGLRADDRIEPGL